MSERRSRTERRRDPARTTFTEAARRNTRRTELEEGIAASIDSEAPERRWVDLDFELRGTSDLRYQIHRVDHNLLWLDAEMGTVVDEITRERELELHEAGVGSNGFESRMLTYYSDDPEAHRSLAEEILHRVYSIDLTDIDRIELSSTMSSDPTDEVGSTGGTESNRSEEEQRVLDWIAESRGEAFADEHAELILAQAHLIGDL